MLKDDILSAFQFRHACKVFDDSKKITPEDFDFLLKTVQLSPSSFGLEPWKVLVVQDPEKRKKLLPVVWGAQGTLPTASHFVIFLSARKAVVHPQSEYILHMMRDVHHLPEDIVKMRQEYYTEHFLKNVKNDREVEDWTGKQTYIALGNMMTCAAMIGIDSCPVEGFLKAETEEVLSQDFGVDLSQYTLSVMLALGYRKNEPRPKTRQELPSIVQWL